MGGQILDSMGSLHRKPEPAPLLRISLSDPDPEEEKKHEELLSNITQIEDRIAYLVGTKDLGPAMILACEAIER